MINFILALFVPFRWMLEKMGADYNQFISLMRLRLLMDSRRENNAYAFGGTMSKQILILALFGSIFAYMTYRINLPSLYVYVFIHTMTMLMMSLMIITEFTTILFDTSENAIIQPLPVKGNTVNLARNAHVFIYLFSIAFFLTFPTLILASYKFGMLSAILFLFTIFLNTILTLFLANILYLGIMRFAGPERLKTIVMYFQIIVTLIFFGGMQMGSRIVGKSILSGMVLTEHWYLFLFPPVFFSGFIEALSHLNFDIQHLIYIAEALCVPFLAVFYTGKYLTPAFNRKLIDLEQGDRGLKMQKPVKTNGFWFRLMSFVFVSQPEEKASFTLVWKMIGRERQFKQTFFPSIGILVIMIATQFFGRTNNLNQLIHGDRYLFLLYFMAIVSINLIAALQIGTNSQAVWILKAVPLSSPAEFFKGTMKAAFARFFMPFFILLSLVIVVLFGIRTLPDVVIVFLLIYLVTMVIYYFQDLNFPFTLSKDALKGGDRQIKMILTLVMLVPLGFLHRFLLHWSDFSNLLLIPLYAVLIYLVNRKMVYQRISWKAVDKVNRY